jgi:tetratricopeptide (TPR) repeat protein
MGQRGVTRLVVPTPTRDGVGQQPQIGYCSSSRSSSSSTSEAAALAADTNSDSPPVKEEASKFPLPDRDKEQALSRIQVEIQERYRAGDYRSALQKSQDFQKESEDHFGRDHPATASAYSNVGLMHKQLGDFDAARSSYRVALKIYQTTVGVDHASYASILHNLGNLNRSQIHFDTSLRATDRLSLVEQAVTYLEQAWKIRLDELGAHHPHTVASRSSWGSTMATRILHHHKAASSSANSTSGQNSYISLLSNEVTQDAWEAAEEHLREALKTSIENPRGPSLPKKKKNKKAQKTQSPVPETHTTQQTLSAASASQNLAVFLKARATTETPYNEAWLDEAKRLYEETLRVRTQLLPKGHPDLYATKFSLGELLESMGDEEAANAVRQEIIDTYDPPAADE